MMISNIKTVSCLLFLIGNLIPGIGPYPIDGYESTGIRRLLRLQQVVSGQIKGTMPIAGALRSIDQIGLQLTEQPVDYDTLLEPDASFTRAINSIFPSLDDSYSIAVLDITQGRPTRYAERKGSARYQPGSVGKLAVAVGFFTELAHIYPDSFEKRRELMRTRLVRAGKWALTDSHTVPFFDPESSAFFKRRVQEDDVFSLYEWLDHMMSVSNNGAASVVWREVVLMRVFGDEYPALTEEQATAYFAATKKSELSNLAIAVVNDPLRDLEISDQEWRLGTFFTRGASSFIPPLGGSTGSARGLMKFLTKLESGIVVDPASSLEIKRLMYMTDKHLSQYLIDAKSQIPECRPSGSDEEFLFLVRTGEQNPATSSTWYSTRQTMSWIFPRNNNNDAYRLSSSKMFSGYTADYGYARI